MARQITIKNIRKAGAFTTGQLAAGEVGVNTSAPRLEYSADGSATTQVANLSEVGAQVGSTTPSALGTAAAGASAQAARADHVHPQKINATDGIPLYCKHGSNASKARPTSDAEVLVMWVGSATPTNALQHDIHIVTD